jgi:hypothetical protein
VSNGGANGLEITSVSSGSVYEIITYNRSTSAFTPLQFESSVYTFNRGNVLVGTTDNAGFKLDVNGTGRFSGNLTINSDLFISSSTAAIVFNSSANFNTQIYQTGGSLVLYTGANPRLTIASTGAATFSSLSGSGNRIVVANSGGTLISAVIGSGLAFDGTTLTATGGSSGSISGSGDSGTIALFTGSTSIGNSVITQSSGNVGINISSPFSKLHVRNSDTNEGTIAVGHQIYPGLIYSSANTGEFRIDNRSSAGAGFITFYPNGQQNTLGNEAMRIANSRNVLIGTDSDNGNRLRVNGSIWADNNISATGDVLIKGSYNPYTATNRGNITLNGTNSNILGFANNTNTRGYILHDGTDIEIVNQSSGQIQFFVASGESFRVLSTGAILTYSALVVGGSLNAFTLQTLAPTGTQNEFWRLGRALLATSSDPEDRWIRVQLGNRIYDILAIDRGAA